MIFYLDAAMARAHAQRSYSPREATRVCGIVLQRAPSSIRPQERVQYRVSKAAKRMCLQETAHVVIVYRRLTLELRGNAEVVKN